MGAAFFLWDFGIKHGDIRALGVLSYAAPVLSTLILVLCGFAPASPSLGVACLLIVSGAATASFGPRSQLAAEAAAGADRADLAVRSAE